ncbi:MAG: NUDIX domain-containing protein [Verrucomicrobiota bacterium]
MQNPAEIFDVVDEFDQVTGQATRADVHRQQLRHRAIHVLLFNSRSELLVQKRSATKDTFPLCYDSSASGHLDSGEDYDACARRELREELGLDLPASAFTRQFKLTADVETGWEFVWVYAVHGDFVVTPNPAELVSVTPMSRAQIESLLTERADSCARAFCWIIREFYRRQPR